VNRGLRDKWREWLLSLPSVGWLAAFFLAPSLVVLAIAFKPVNPYAGSGRLDARHASQPHQSDYPSIVWRTIWISVATTALCIFLATPTGYYMRAAGRITAACCFCSS